MKVKQWDSRHGLKCKKIPLQYSPKELQGEFGELMFIYCSVHKLLGPKYHESTFQRHNSAIIYTSHHFCQTLNLIGKNSHLKHTHARL